MPFILSLSKDGAAVHFIDGSPLDKLRVRLVEGWLGVARSLTRVARTARPRIKWGQPEGACSPPLGHSRTTVRRLRSAG